MKHIVILGSGTGGTMIANKLRRSRNEEKLKITVIDKDDRHIYQPGLLFVPFGLYSPDEIVRPRVEQLHDGIDFVIDEIAFVDIDHNEIHLSSGDRVGYDALVVASGVDLLFDETEGLRGAGWRENVFDFYTLDGAAALCEKLKTFESGRLVINIVDMPIKCPVASLEFAFLADWYFHEKHIRDAVEIVYVTPLDGAFTRPESTRVLAGLLEEKQIRLVTEFNTGEVDGAAGVLRSFDGREESFDLAVVTPVHGGAAYIGRSPGLGNALNYVATDVHTLQSEVRENIFAIGDATNLPNSKAGSTTHFEAEVLVDNLLAHLDGEPLSGHYDGHVNCFIETGFDRALLIDFNYELEPVTGKFPFAGVGPLPLLKESKMNHLGKLLFQKLYWSVLLPGRSMPGISSAMSRRGKNVPTSSEPEPQA